MAKKPFLKDEFKDDLDGLRLDDVPAAGGGEKSKVPGLSKKAFSIVKFLIGICLLPFVFAATESFLNEFSRIDSGFRYDFWSGVITFLLVYLFIFEPARIYQKGQKLLEIIFHFFAPLVRVAPYVLPIYTIIVFVLYFVLSMFMRSRDLVSYTMVAVGFSFALHLVFGAKTLRAKQDFFKASYIFGFSFVYIINMMLLCLLLNLVFDRFSFVNYFNQAWHIAVAMFSGVFRQLFGA